MKTHPDLLATAGEIADLAQALSQESIIAFDTEFIRESTFYPMVEIIQIATAKESWLVDAAAFKRKHKPGPQGSYDPAIKPLLDVFENRSILKILHAAQGDQECLYTSFGVIASPTLDTAVAASLCGYGDGIGLGKLLKAIMDVTLPKGHARTNWSVRPLPQQLLEYAHDDVKYLVEAGERLLEQLSRKGRREWALELSAKWEDQSLYESDAEGMVRKIARSGRLDKREYAALFELVRWRENRVRQLNLPRRWIADDAVLVDLARVRPKDLAHLSAFRGLNKGELKNSGAEILNALKQASEEEGKILPPASERHEIPTIEESQVIDLLKCYVGILADRHKIAAKHLISSSQLLSFVRSHVESPQDLVEAGILEKDAAHLIGEEIIAFVRGKRALSVSGTKIQIVKVEE